MHVRERMIRERIATHPCEGCGHAYGMGTVLVLARRPAAWLVLASCGQCEHRCIYLVSFPDGSRETERARTTSDAPSLTVRQAHELSEEFDLQAKANRPISADEVAAMRSFLVDFDGDFRRLFGADGQSPA
jgi:hypothetical protein